MAEITTDVGAGMAGLTAARTLAEALFPEASGHPEHSLVNAL
jgi:hypothetical protein